MTATDRGWKVFDYVEGGMPAAVELPEDEAAAVGAWLELLAAGPRYAGGTLLPAIHIGNTLDPSDPDYEPPVENVFSRDIPGTSCRCRYQVHYDAGTIHVVGFQRAHRH